MNNTLNTNNKNLPLFRVANSNSEQHSLATNQILDLYLKGMSLYKTNLNNYFSLTSRGSTHNKLVASLILQLALRSVRPEANKEYELNVRISNFYYALARLANTNEAIATSLSSRSQVASLLFNVTTAAEAEHSCQRLLFCPNRLLKPVAANSVLGYNNLINELIRQGNEIINDLDYQITLQQNIITNIKSAKIANTINSLSLGRPANTGQDNLVAANAASNCRVAAVATPNSLIENVEQKLLINRIFKSINKSNEIKIVNTINSIEKNNNFDQASLQTLEVAFANNSSPSPSSTIIGYNFNNLNNKLIKNIYSLLVATFKSMYCLISKPVFIITPDKIIIQLFYYLFIPTILKLKKIHRYGYNRRNKLSNASVAIKRRKNITKLYRKFRKINVNVRIKLRKLSNYPLIKVYPNRFKKLCEILSNLLHKPVELDLIRLHYPYNDSTILVNLLGIMINKIKLRIIIRRLFEKAVLKNLNKVNKDSLTNSSNSNIIPAFLSGINIKVAGRLLTHKVVPRQTVKITKRGASAKGKINFSDVARFTNKNKRGAFSITITSGQNYL